MVSDCRAFGDEVISSMPLLAASSVSMWQTMICHQCGHFIPGKIKDVVLGESLFIFMTISYKEPY